MKVTGRFCLPVIWAALVLGAAVKLVRYQMTPGAAAARPAPAAWPEESPFARDTRRMTLIMFLHPQCPCSRASVNELSMVMSRCGNGVDARVFVVSPRNAPTDFTQGELFRKAQGIEGVSVGTDPDARTAHEFAATTSGDVLLYGADGRLLFKGGITDGRGHEGDNDGLESVLAIVQGGQPARRQTPVFGCSLED